MCLQNFIKYYERFNSYGVHRFNSHGVHLVNINVYAKFHHNIPLSSRDRAITTFSEFGARQSLDQRKISFRNLLG